MAIYTTRTLTPRFATPLLALALTSLLQHLDSDTLASEPTNPNESWGTSSLIANTRPTLGATSCAATACHAGPSAGVSSTSATRGSEYPLWLESDPHAKSWQTLNSPKSLDILRRLNIVVDGTLLNVPAFKNCLACHNSSTELASAELDSAELDSNLPLPKTPEGVGCEACHGPANQWKHEHYQGPHSLHNAIENLGMVNTKSLPTQAKTCTLCHVGAPDRDMNHDIIAAGHPALYFDFNTYLQAYPKHWRLSSDSQSNPNRSAQQWLAGQLAATDSELELLQTRLSALTHPDASHNSTSTSTWPEFANFQCTDCHQTLSNSPTSKSTPLGQPSPRLWNLQALWILNSPPIPANLPPPLNTLSLSAQNPPEPQILTLQILRQKLSQQMQSLFPPNATAKWQTADQHHYAANLWNHLAHDQPSPDWEITSLAYIASLPAFASQTNPPNPHIKSQISILRESLLFPPNSQSPQTSTNINWKSSLTPLIDAFPPNNAFPPIDAFP